MRKLFILVASLLVAISTHAEIISGSPPPTNANNIVADTFGHSAPRMYSVAPTGAALVTFNAPTASTGGAITAPAVAATAYDAWTKVRATSTAGANVSAGAQTFATATAGSLRGSTAFIGGFKFRIRFGSAAGFNAGHRAFSGIYAATLNGGTAGAGITGVDPSTNVNTIYIGFDDTDANWRVCSSSAAGPTVCGLDTGVPKTTAGVMWELEIPHPPGATSVNWILHRLDNGDEFSGAIANANLPDNATFLKWGTWCGAAATGVACAIDISQVYWEDGLDGF